MVAHSLPFDKDELNIVLIASLVSLNDSDVFNIISDAFDIYDKTLTEVVENVYQVLDLDNKPELKDKWEQIKGGIFDL